jgi:hypothetical protein
LGGGGGGGGGRCSAEKPVEKVVDEDWLNSCSLMYVFKRRESRDFRNKGALINHVHRIG